MMKKPRMDKEGLWVLGKRLLRSIRAIPQWILLDHASGVGMLILGVSAAISLGLVVAILLVPPEEGQISQGDLPQNLAVEKIDRLTAWFEVVQRERESGLQLPTRELFVRED